MNTFKKMLVGAAAVATLATPAAAEEIIIGAQIAPIASLVILGGNKNLDFVELVDANNDGTTIAKSVSAAKFFVNTNMPKWNLYFAWGNGGILKNANGQLAFVGAQLDLSANLNVCDDAACTAGTEVIATGAEDEMDIAIGSTAIQDLLSIVKTGANTLSPTGTTWFDASGVNVFSGDILVGAAGETAPTLAGAYNETIYLTLASTY